MPVSPTIFNFFKEKISRHVSTTTPLIKRIKLHCYGECELNKQRHNLIELAVVHKKILYYSENAGLFVFQRLICVTFIVSL